MTADDEKHLTAVADDRAWTAIDKHAETCPLATSQIEPRLRQVEITLARLTGFMFGSGLLGGTIGGLAAKLLTN